MKYILFLLLVASGNCFGQKTVNAGPSKLPIHWTKDSSQAYLLIEDTHFDYFSISDSTGELARRDNKTRKWTIKNCKRALEIVYQMDSIRNAESLRKEPEYKIETLLHDTNAKNK